MARKSASTDETIAKLLELSGRDHLPLARAFVQRRDARGKPVPGPLAKIMTAGHDRGLHQYLLLHAAASAAPWSVARDSRIWARALALDPGQVSARSAISKNWAWLERAQLISRARRGRLSEVTLLRDDGSGDSYDRHPHGRNERYFKLPYAFWTEGWYRKLDLSSIGILLIGLSLNDGFVLPGDQVQTWYGISSTTLTKGLAGLRRQGLLDVRRDHKIAPLAPEGYTWEHTYTLKPPFGPRGRRARRGAQS